MKHFGASLALFAALLMPAAAAAAEGDLPHQTLGLTVGLAGRRVSGDRVDDSSLGGTARAFASLTQSQADGGLLHMSGFAELGGIGGAVAGSAGMDLRFGVKLPLQGRYGAFFRYWMRAAYASDLAATFDVVTFPGGEAGFVAATPRVHFEIGMHGGMEVGSFSPALVTPRLSPPDLPSFATTTERKLGPGGWGAGLLLRTPYGHLDASWDRFEPSGIASGPVDALEARACAGHWAVICGGASFVHGNVLVPFRGIHDARLMTFGVSVGFGREP